MGARSGCERPQAGAEHGPATTLPEMGNSRSTASPSLEERLNEITDLEELEGFIWGLREFKGQGALDVKTDQWAKIALKKADLQRRQRRGG